MECSWDTKANQNRTLLNTYVSKVNRGTFRAAHELTSGLDSRGTQRESDMVV